MTKAVMCHEAGHRRFTSPSVLPAHVHFVSNVLEDQRIEYLMEEEFAGVRPLLKKLSAVQASYTRGSTCSQSC